MVEHEQISLTDVLDMLYSNPKRFTHVKVSKSKQDDVWIVIFFDEKVQSTQVWKTKLLMEDGE